MLTAFNPRIEEFRAWLGWRRADGLLVVIARLEFHATHPRMALPFGVLRHFGDRPCSAAPSTIREIAEGRSATSKDTFSLTDSVALETAFGLLSHYRNALRGCSYGKTSFARRSATT